MPNMNRAICQFAAVKIRDMVMEDDHPRYQRAMDRVIEDIFGFPKLASKIAGCRTEDEVFYVFRKFGFDNLVIFRDSRLCDALEDLLHIDHDIRRLRKKLNAAKDKGIDPKKNEIKMERRLIKLYQKVVKVICKRLNLREKNSRYYKSNYKAAKYLLEKDDDWDFFRDFGVYGSDGTFYPDEEDDGVDYFDQYLDQRTGRRVASSHRRSGRRYRDLEMGYFNSIDDDDDSDWDDDDDGVDDFDEDYFDRYLRETDRSANLHQRAIQQAMHSVYGATGQQRPNPDKINEMAKSWVNKRLGESQPAPVKSDLEKSVESLAASVAALTKLQAQQMTAPRLIRNPTPKPKLQPTPMDYWKMWENDPRQKHPCAMPYRDEEKPERISSGRFDVDERRSDPPPKVEITAVIDSEVPESTTEPVEEMDPTDITREELIGMLNTQTSNDE